MVTSFYSVRISDELVHGAILANLIFKGIDKLSIILNAVTCGDMTIQTKEKDSSLLPTIYSRSVTIDDISGHSFITTTYVTGWVL